MWKSRKSFSARGDELAGDVAAVLLGVATEVDIKKKRDCADGSVVVRRILDKGDCARHDAQSLREVAVIPRCVSALNIGSDALLVIAFASEALESADFASDSRNDTIGPTQ